MFVHSYFSNFLRVLFLLVVFRGAAVHAETIRGVIDHGPRTVAKVAVTFDACPTDLADEYDDSVVATLIKENVHATLFMSGRWVEKNPEKAKMLASMPQFEIAAHSYYHPHLPQKDVPRIEREIKRTQEMIKKVTGKTPKYFRAPYCEIDPRVVQLASAAGLTTIQYDVASGDPDPHLSARKIVQGVLHDAKNGSIIIFHMNRKGVRTAEVLPEVIRGLRKKGFELVTVGELLK